VSFLVQDILTAALQDLGRIAAGETPTTTVLNQLAFASTLTRTFGSRAITHRL